MRLFGVGTHFRRLAILAVFVIWVVIISLPVLGLLLAMNGELALTISEHNEYRVWLLMDDEERGIGWSSKNMFSDNLNNNCVINRVNFILWEGDSENVNTFYCECYSGNNGELEYTSAQVCSINY